MDNTQTGAAPGDSGARPGRKSDPAVAIARLQATLDGLQDSFDRALARLDANAERQDRLIAEATVALAEAKRILQSCDDAARRIDALPTANDYKLLSDRLGQAIGDVNRRIDNIDKEEGTAATIVGIASRLPWYKIVGIVIGGIVGLVLVLMILKKLNLV